MAVSGQMTAPALQALNDGKLAGSWTVDASRSQVGLRTKSMWGLAPVNGVFRDVSGNAAVTAEGEVSGTIAVRAGSIDTKNKKRDEHLRSADFFEAGEYPEITFSIGGVRPSGPGIAVTGGLTVHGVTRPLTFEAQVSSFDGDEVWLDAQVTVDRSDFGLTWSPMGMASMNNTLTIHAVLTRS
jgi:polyisoprenoid-binding protein YceI